MSSCSDSDSDIESEPEIFHDENLVIISSSEKINMMQWKDYVHDNWDRLIRENSRLLVLAGVHGGEDGRLGRNEDKVKEAFVETSLRQIKLLKRDFQEEIEEKNVSFEVKDVGDHRNRGMMDEKKFIRAVKDFNPTIILLAFCWSRKSELNDLLRAAGIYSTLILREDLAQVTESRHVHLDQDQKSLVEKIAKEEPKNIFLWGSSGSGKTLMLAEALKMKTSQLTRKGCPFQVIVTTMMGDILLLEDLKQKYLKDLSEVVDIRFSSTDDLSKEFDLKRNAINETRGWMEELFSLLANRQNGMRIIILIDEILPVRRSEPETVDNVADWSSLKSRPNVDFLVAQSTFSKNMKFFKVAPPSDKKVVGHRLNTPHRNSAEIAKFLRFEINHNGHYPSIEKDLTAPFLPPGTIPVWIERSQKVRDAEALEFVKNRLGKTSHGVTVIFNDDSFTEEANQWCIENGWRYASLNTIRGTEANNVVVMDVHLDSEVLSRGRNQLLIVGTQGKDWANDEMCNAAFEHISPLHKCEQSLINFKLEGVCPHAGQLLLEHVTLGSEEEHKEWESRAKFRKMLNKEVKKVICGNDSTVKQTAKDDAITYKLLQDDVVVDILRLMENRSGESSLLNQARGCASLVWETLSRIVCVRKGGDTPFLSSQELADRLAQLIEQELKRNLRWEKIKKLRSDFQTITSMALDNDGELSRSLSLELLENDDIMEATNAAVQSRKSKDEKAIFHLHTLFMLISKARAEAGDSDQANQFYTKAVGLFKEILDGVLKMAINSESMADIVSEDLLREKNVLEAVKAMAKCVAFKDPSAFKPAVCHLFNILGNLRVEAGDSEAAEKFYAAATSVPDQVVDCASI